MRQHLLSSFLALCTTALLPGCASLPPPGSEVTVEVVEVVDPAAITSKRWRTEDGEALRTAGLGAAGLPILRLQCAVTTDGWWEALAAAPAGFSPQKGTTLHVRVVDAGTNNRTGFAQVIRPTAPQLPAAGQAHRFVPDWRERGMSRNYERVELPADRRDKYLVVQGWYQVACRP